MSYILEALKKSEQERKQAIAAQDATSLRESVTYQRGRRPVWVIVIAFLLLGNLAFLGWYLWGAAPQLPASHALTPGAQTKTGAETPEQNREAVPVSVQVASAEKNRHTQGSPDSASQPGSESSIKSSSEEGGGSLQVAGSFLSDKGSVKTESAETVPEDEKPRAKPDMAALTKKPESVSESVSEMSAGKADQKEIVQNNRAGEQALMSTEKGKYGGQDKPAGGKVVYSDVKLTHQNESSKPVANTKPGSAASEYPDLAELSADFRRQIPELDVNVHVYSKVNEERFVLVKMSRYQEGDELPGGMILERILEDGMLLSFRGRTFVYTR